MMPHSISQRKLTLVHAIFAGILFILCLLTTLSYAGSEKNYQTAFFETETGSHEFTLEIADTDYKKTKGLMYKKRLNENAGMVFIYDTPTKAGIWMKNTFIPLDIIFVNCDNVVVDFVTRQPHTTEITVANEKICKIVEVNAGLNEKISLKRGDRVNFQPPVH